jgi:uncharacterized protein (DUF2384 family)
VQNLTYDPTQLRINEVRKEIAQVVLDPDKWLITPHDLLGGREPLDLLNSGNDEDEQKVRDLIESIKHGIFS